MRFVGIPSACTRSVALAIGLTAILSLAPASNAATAGSATPPRYAVLDFDAAESRREVDPWSFGLADLLSAALGERGGDVLERHALRSVLSERGLEGAGLTAMQVAVREPLPHVRYLVKGVIDATGVEDGPEHFRLSLSVLDTERGTSALELSREGHYPQDVARVLEELAAQLLAELPGDGSASRRPKARLWGMTRSPDVALQFYKGLDHILHGRPEFAAEYFRQAHLTDRSFWLAAAWRMRAYQQLGLVDLAGYVRQTLLESNEGRQVFLAVAPSLAHEREQLVVALAHSPVPDAPTRLLEQRVREALAAAPGFRLFSPAWIRDVADELDLRLSGELAPLEVEKTPWLAVDAVVRATQEQGVVRLALLDALSGRVLAEAEARIDKVDARAASQLVARLGEPPGLQQRGARRARRPLDYTPPAGDIGVYTRQGYAYLLRDFADHPMDPVRLSRHIEVHSLHSHAEHVPGTYDKEWRYLQLLWERMIEGVEPGDLNAPNWLSLALWKLRLHGYLGDADRDDPRAWFHRGKRRQPLGRHFARLMHGHPQSVAARCVRYAIALEHLERGDPRRATEMLMSVAGGLAQTADDPTGPSVSNRAMASVYFVTALAAQAADQPEVSRRYARRAAQAAELVPRGRGVEHVVPAVAYIPPGRAGHATGRWLVQEMPKTLVVGGQLRFRNGEPLDAAISRLAAGGGNQPAEPSLAALYDHASRQRGAAGIQARLAYLRRLVSEVERGTALHLSVYYGRPLDTLIPWLHQHVSSSQRVQLEALVAELVAGLRDRSKPYRLRDALAVNLFASAQLDDQIDVIAERGLASRSPSSRSMGAIAKSGLVSRQAGATHSAGFLEAELGRFERDFPQARGASYLDLAHACAQAFGSASDPEGQARTYRRALEARLFEREEDSKGARQAEPHRASLRFLLARVERDRGEALTAADLFKQVIEMAEAHPDWLLHYSGRGARGIGTLRLYAAAVKELEELRGWPASR